MREFEPGSDYDGEELTRETLRGKSPGKRTLTLGIPGVPIQAHGLASEAHGKAASFTASGAGRPMPRQIQSQWDSVFQTDFSAVRIHENSAAPKQVGATAFTQGTDIHLAPGAYDPTSKAGKELMGHELTHVVQQRGARVAPTQFKGAAINADPALEAEADTLGARAARGETVSVTGSSASLGGSTVDARPIQRLALGASSGEAGARDWVREQVTTPLVDQSRASKPGGVDSSSGAADSGSPLPVATRKKMEGSFGTDLSEVRVHQDGSAAEMGAVAYTQGSDIHFSSGAYNPDSGTGQALLGHELAHVVQQRAGRVTGTQGKGAKVNLDPALETEADVAGDQAARGEKAIVPGAATQRSLDREDSPVQGMWWLVKDLGKGILEGIGREAAKDMTKEQLRRAIGAAAPALISALEAAMQSPELRRMLRNLHLLGDAKAAALAFVKDHARAMASDLAAYIREQLPGLPEDLMPEVIRDLEARIAARLRNTYVAEALDAAAQVTAAMAEAAASVHIGLIIDREILRHGGEQIRAMAQAAAKPVMDAAETAVETAAQVAEAIEDAELPLPGFKPVVKIGRKIGKKAYDAVKNAPSAPIDATVLDPLTDATDAATDAATDQLETQLRPGSGIGVDPAVLYKAAKTTSEFAMAQETDERINALASPAVDYGMGLLGAAAAPALATLLPIAAAPLVPAMATAGAVVLGTRYVKPLVAQASSAAAPHLEAFGNTTVGTPFKKAAQGVHTAANVVNLGLTTLAAPLPYIGGGWASIEAAQQSTSDSYGALMGHTPQEEEAPAPEAEEAAASPSAAPPLSIPLGMPPSMMFGMSGMAAMSAMSPMQRMRLQAMMGRPMGMPMMGMPMMGMPMSMSMMYGMPMMGGPMGMPMMGGSMGMPMMGGSGLEAEAAEPVVDEAAATTSTSTTSTAAPAVEPTHDDLVARLEALKASPAAPAEAVEVVSTLEAIQVPSESAPTPVTPAEVADPVQAQLLARLEALRAPVAPPPAPVLADPVYAQLVQRLRALGGSAVDLPEPVGPVAPITDEQLEELEQMPAAPTGRVAEDPLTARLRALGGAPSEVPAPVGPVAPITDEQLEELEQMPAAPTGPVVEDPLIARLRALGGAPSEVPAPIGPVAPITDEQLEELEHMPAAPTGPVAEDPLIARLRALGVEPMIVPEGPEMHISEAEIASMPAAPTHALPDPLLIRLRELGVMPMSEAEEQAVIESGGPGKAMTEAEVIEVLEGAPLPPRIAQRATRRRQPIALKDEH